MTHPFQFIEPSMDPRKTQPIYETLSAPEHWQGPVLDEKILRGMSYGSLNAADRQALSTRFDRDTCSEIGHLFLAATQEGYVSHKIDEGKPLPIPDASSNSFVRITTDSRKALGPLSPARLIANLRERDRIKSIAELGVDLEELIGNLMLQKTLYDSAVATFVSREPKDRRPLRRIPVFERRVTYARATTDGNYLAGILSQSFTDGHLRPSARAAISPPTSVGQLYTESTADRHLAKVVAAELITPNAVQYRPPDAPRKRKRLEHTSPSLQARLAEQ